MNSGHFYIDGKWVVPASQDTHQVFDPSTERAFATIFCANQEDVDRAVRAAKSATQQWAASSVSERLSALQRLIDVYERRIAEMGAVISKDVGAPRDMALNSRAASGLMHLKAFAKVLGEMPFEMPFAEHLPTQQILLEPVGVAALITPWNWPMNQICLKVGAAVAAGCTVVLKPSEVAPMSAILFAEFADEAGLPAGVFNLIHGDGAHTGTALVVHPDVDMVSFTGSTRAGIAISKGAANSVKRVSLELGGKSPNIVFADCDLEARVRHGVASCFSNSGQSCNAPTRMLVERSVYDRAVRIAADAASNTSVDLPELPGNHIGPLVSQVQFEKVQRLISGAISEGARLAAGGSGRPSTKPVGWYARPTVFADVRRDMTIWREEVFGPVLVMTPFDFEDDAVELANDTPFGLAGYVQTGSPERAKRISRRLRAGTVQVNGAARAPGTPFGGYKQSGNGREGGQWGIHDFLEVKSVSGWPVA